MVNDGSAKGRPTPDEILAALDRTGFIFEYRVAQELRQVGLEAFLNFPFTDPDTGKSREIDIIAHLDDSVTAKGFSVRVAAILVIECKNYEDPLIVVGEEQDTVYRSDPVVTFDPLQLDFPKLSNRYPSLLFNLKLWKRPSHSTKGFVGTQLIKMRRQSGRWQATNDSIYDSIVHPLFKATKEERSTIEANERDNPEDEIERRLAPTLYYLIPALVTSGDVYTVDVTSNTTPTVAQAAWAPLTRHFDDGLFQMDVVGFSHIEKYLKERVIPVLEDAKKVMRSHMQWFNPEWLQGRYGTPSDVKFYQWLTEYNTKYRSTDKG